jgi:hypothetical protein
VDRIDPDDLEAFVAALLALPGGPTSVERERLPGCELLEVRRGDVLVDVEWRPGGVIGISKLDGTTLPFVPPDAVVDSPGAALAEVLRLLDRGASPR